MTPEAFTLQVDGNRYPVRFGGFDWPLQVRLDDGGEIRLLPWCYGDHLEALRASLRIGGPGLGLDAERFARRVLSRSGIAEPPADLAPLALWWAGGGEPEAAAPEPDGRYRIGPARMRLRAWSNGERLAALGASLAPDGDGESLDLVGYLDAMVRASIAAMEPEMELEELDAQATARLLQAVVALNVADRQLPELAAGNAAEAQALARSTLRLCGALGWTPSQVWATPAPEVDRLLALLDRAAPEPAAPPATPRSGLAGHPDATVLCFEED